MQIKGMLLHPDDNVVVLLDAVRPGDTINIQPGQEELVALEAVAFGHKLARRALEKGQVVLKYGKPMGRTFVDIAKGAHVHVHNISGLMGEGAGGVSGEEVGGKTGEAAQ